MLSERRRYAGAVPAAIPFPQIPPRFVRAVIWQYWFTTMDEKRQNWRPGGAASIWACGAPELDDGRQTATVAAVAMAG